MPLQMFVYPVRGDAALPDVFTKFAVKPANPIEVDIDTIGRNRERWINDWMPPSISWKQICTAN